jgi:hypothetical protein
MPLADLIGAPGPPPDDRQHPDGRAGAAAGAGWSEKVSWES